MTNYMRQLISEGIKGSQIEADYDPFQTRKLSSSLSKYAPLFCLQIVTSLLSVFATIVVVRISVPKLDSTYQRYIFMLNMALLVNSIFLGLHPLLAPKEDDGAYWAIGNSGTCTSVGFFLIFGSIMVSMYHTAVAFYFYFSVETIHRNYNSKSKKKVKKKNSDRRVATTSQSESSSLSGESSAESSASSSTKGTIGSKAEIMANMVCLFFPALFAGAAATSGSLGFDPSVDLCTIYGSFRGFDDTTWLVMRSIFRYSLLISGVLTFVLTVVVRFRVGFFRKKQYDDDSATSDNNKNSNASSSSMGDPDGNAGDFERQIIGQKLNAISAQCLFYAVSYVSSYVWFIALAFMSAGDGDDGNGPLYVFQTMTVIFYPLLGVFNCAIYVRPRVQMLQIMYPEDSYITVLRVAMSKAGDPEEIEEVRAKIYGSDYYGPEDDDEASGVSGGSGNDDEFPPPDSDIPTSVHFGLDATGEGKSSGASDSKNDDSVSQISDI